jgi:hypothetical protein
VEAITAITAIVHKRPRMATPARGIILARGITLVKPAKVFRSDLGLQNTGEKNLIVPMVSKKINSEYDLFIRRKHYLPEY